MVRQVLAAAITHPLRIAPVANQTYGFQRRHVPRHPRLANAEQPHQLANTMFATVPEQADGGKTGRLSKRGQEVNSVGHELLYQNADMRTSARVGFRNTGALRCLRELFSQGRTRQPHVMWRYG